MSSDQLVSSRAVLDALMQVKRQGTTRVLQQLEHIEPDLASYLMESLSTIHASLFELGGRPRATTRVTRDVESLVLVCITALRQAGYETWRSSVAGTSLAEEDAAPDACATQHDSLQTPIPPAASTSKKADKSQSR